MSSQARARDRRVVPAQQQQQPSNERADERPVAGGTVLDSGGLLLDAPGREREASERVAPLPEAASTLGLEALQQPPDLDVTVLAFAQWVSELRSRQHNAQHQMQAEMSMIRNAITSNHTDLSDFKRHGAAIQQQMQSEINEIRESLSNVFMEITAAVRNNAAADQDIKLKIQSLNEQAVRNETAFAQLADAADQSQSKLRSAVTEMQLASERMRDELGGLNRHTDSLEGTLGERSERIGTDTDQLAQELHAQLERRREHLKKMVGDVQLISESLQGLRGDFEEQRRGSGDTQGRLQASLLVVDQALRRDAGGSGARSLQTAGDVLQSGARYATQVQGRHSAMPSQVHIPAGARPVSVTNRVYR
mmetsp:Transcript_144514/g.402647  ORF Transcript_144514/g.402647 Transcript_144514/m.402647 type:complete len:364 (-) Transcript_144514:99-1190(-)